MWQDLNNTHTKQYVEAIRSTKIGISLISLLNNFDNQVHK